ncbi:unnamed protein product [Acanthoscelides obtectus]|uniref:Thioredoxin n=1 Tax=Acanthoscelides obtectus TaxID=200917 RepID=A0A9P0LKY4_ACAOB|nr:unnamed protein product [Acanthoscelides obtectus]CAK1659556.1 Thioredoxin-T [Acanthoscelides obtectus]
MESVVGRSEFTDKLQSAGDKLVIADFYADWCAPCKMVGPKFAELIKNFPDVVILTINLDDNEELGQDYGIESMPTFVLLKHSEVVATYVGTNMDKLKKVIEQQLNPL